MSKETKIDDQTTEMVEEAIRIALDFLDDSIGSLNDYSSKEDRMFMCFESLVYGLLYKLFNNYEDHHTADSFRKRWIIYALEASGTYGNEDAIDEVIKSTRISYDN